MKRQDEAGSATEADNADLLTSAAEGALLQHA